MLYLVMVFSHRTGCAYEPMINEYGHMSESLAQRIVDKANSRAFSHIEYYITPVLDI